VRNVFVIGPDQKVKLILVYPMTAGRNFEEVLRVIDSLQRTAAHRVATPVNWLPGQDVVIAGSVSDVQAQDTYPDGWKAPRPYLRIVPDLGRQRAAPGQSGHRPAEVTLAGRPSAGRYQVSVGRIKIQVRLAAAGIVRLGRPEGNTCLDHGCESGMGG
jgi:hypothetical protein